MLRQRPTRLRGNEDFILPLHHNNSGTITSSKNSNNFLMMSRRKRKRDAMNPAYLTPTRTVLYCFSLLCIIGFGIVVLSLLNRGLVSKFTHLYFTDKALMDEVQDNNQQSKHYAKKQINLEKKRQRQRKREENNDNENVSIGSNVDEGYKKILCPNPQNHHLFSTEGWLNDNYCDCIDGSDEPNTPACSNIEPFVQKKVFHCKDGSNSIFASRVGDGVYDCNDQSDEIV